MPANYLTWSHVILQGGRQKSKETGGATTCCSNALQWGKTKAVGLAFWIRKGSERRSQFSSSVRAWGEILTRHENASLQKSTGFDVYCCLDTASAATFYVDSFLIGWCVSSQDELILPSRLLIITTKSEEQWCRSGLCSDSKHLELWLLFYGPRKPCGTMIFMQHGQNEAVTQSWQAQTLIQTLTNIIQTLHEGGTMHDGKTPGLFWQQISS